MARNARLRSLGTGGLLLAIVLIALGFRAFNLANWDGMQGLHPDERYMSMTVNSLQLPRSVGAYFDSATSPLNPRNYEASVGFVYGTLPTTLTRVVGVLGGWNGYNELTVVGRALSTLFDLVTCVTLFFLGRLVYGRKVGALAAALYALTVMPIQQSHFFTTDNFAVAFATLALFFTTRLAISGRWRDALLAGCCIGAATASKINLAVLGGMVAVAVFQFWFLRPHQDSVATAKRRRDWGLLKAGALLVFAGIMTLVCFRVLEPDSFTGPELWNIWPDARFRHAIESVRGLVNGSVDYPPSHQWASRTPYVWPWYNMVVWGMGLPLGIAAWASFLVAGLRFVRPRHNPADDLRWRHVVPWLWVALYFAWQGGGFNPSLRYFLPIYPQLIMFAAWGAIAAGAWLRRRVGAARSTAPAGRRLLIRTALPAALLLMTTLGWAWAFTRIYARPHTRLAASAWILENAPRGSGLTTEQWDDALPHTNGNGSGCDPFCLVETQPYAEDEPAKFFGREVPGIGETGLAPADAIDDSLVGRIEQADYIVLSSARVYSSIQRLPHRFPATIRYYEALFDGSLGFDLVADFQSFPTLFGLPIPDLAAEEQFHVYDHPRVLIFRKTADFNPQTARDIMTGGIVWDELYRVSARITSDAPDALRLTEAGWGRLQRSDGRSFFDAPGPIGPAWLWALAAWVLATELLGLAAFGILSYFGLRLPDRGLFSARFLGLLLFALPASLIAASGHIGVSRTGLAVWFGLFVGFGVRLLWMERQRTRCLLRAYRSLFWAGQATYATLFGLSLLLRGVSSTVAPGRGDFGLAQWSVLLQSPILPPPDPLFAGGRLVTPYAATLPVATVARLVGLPPTLTFNLALATLFALAVSLVFVVVMRPLRGEPRTRAPLSRWAVPAFAGLLVIAPGFVTSANSLTAVGMLAAGRLGILAVLGLALGVGLLIRAYPRNDDGMSRALNAPTLAFVALVTAALGLLRAHDRWGFLAVVLPVTLIVLVYLAYQPSRWRLETVVQLAGIGLAVLLIDHLVGAGEPVRTQFIPALFGPIGTIPVAAVALGSVLIACVASGLRLARLGGRARERDALRTMAVWLTALVGVGFFTVASRAGAGQLRADAHLLFALSLVLLVCAAGWGLPALARPRRQPSPRASTLMATVMLGLIVVGGTNMLRARLTASSDASSSALSPGLAGAVDALVADAAGTPVIATAPTSAVPAIIARSGLPALLVSPDAQAELREILRPSVDAVMNGRTRALGDIYGADPDSAARQLATYHVGYALVGPDERAMYGPTAGAALRELEARGTLERVYEREDVALYQYSPAAGTPPFVARPVDLGLPELKTGMLDRPLAELPVVDEYGWNRWANENAAFAIILWLVVIELLGLLALPLSARIFSRATDGGWPWSKLVGLVVWGYLVWLPVSLGWWNYTWAALLIGAVALGGLSWLAAGRSRARSFAAFKAAPREIICFEALFLGAFGLWTLVRAANPDLWHPTLGGEKPFEFGMLNAIVRSPVMPPPDPFFSGGVINYYYYGLFLVSLPIRATGIDPAIAFNLIVPLLFALVVTGATALVRDISGRWRWGLVGATLVTILGPIASVVPFGESRGVLRALEALRPGLSGWGGRIGDWFWGPSRIIPGTINEFPFFSYLFADLHPHMIALPITILAAALALQFVRGGAGLNRSVAGWPSLVMASLVLGTLAVANSWDAPTYALLIGGALIGHAWRRMPRHAGQDTRVLHLARAGGLALAPLAGGLLLYLPFFMQFRAMVGGIGRVSQPDTLLQFVSIYGTSLHVVLALLAGLCWVVLQRFSRPLLRRAWRRGVVALPLLALALLLGAWAFAGAPASAQDVPAGRSLLPPVLAVLVGLSVALALGARLRDEEWMVLWLVIVALMVALGIQIIFVRDHLAGGTHERMNTVFKFGLQIWTLLALGAAAALPLVLRLLRRAGEEFLGGWFTVLLVLLLAGAVYPIVATPSRLSLRFSHYPGLTLDGLAFMDKARYEHEGKLIEMKWDAQAIRWLKQNVRGLPVILQSDAEFYRAYGVRIAANTGFPTVLGRLHQDEQRPAAPVLEREADVRTIYSTPDAATAVNLLAKYQVDYVYVGPAERNFYDPAGLPKWDTLVDSTLDVAYENQEVRLYRVRPGLRPAFEPNAGAGAPVPVAPTAEPGPAVDESMLAGFEAAHQARPDDGPTAFGLATLYIQSGRLAEAAAVLATAAPTNLDDISLHHMLGDTQAQLGRADEAVAAWRTAADSDPSSGNLAKLGTGLTRLGRFEEAERILRRALERDPGDSLVHFYLAEVAVNRDGPGDADLARQEYTTFLAQSPPDSPFRETAEQALQRLGR